MSCVDGCPDYKKCLYIRFLGTELEFPIDWRPDNLGVVITDELVHNERKIFIRELKERPIIPLVLLNTAREVADSYSPPADVEYIFYNNTIKRV